MTEAEIRTEFLKQGTELLKLKGTLAWRVLEGLLERKIAALDRELIYGSDTQTMQDVQAARQARRILLEWWAFVSQFAEQARICREDPHAQALRPVELKEEE